MISPPVNETLGHEAAASSPAAQDATLDLGVESAQRRLGDYELHETLGEGGMGVVYRARQLSLDREVAVKVLSAQWATRNFTDRFREEAQNAARLQHPNIVAIHEVGTIEDRHFYSMRLVRGETLADLRRRAGRLEPAQAAALMVPIARAIEYAHHLGVLHLDLKPANVLIDEDGVPHVADFGLARRMQRELAVTTDGVSGTPSYMAPEQALGGQVSPATDVWGLGAMLYELITGQPPFLGQTPQETLKLVRDGTPPRARALVPTLPRDLEAILDKCLARIAAHRYASAGAVADDLAAFVDGHPVSARPLNPLQRLEYWVRRERKFAIAAGLAVIGLLIGFVATTRQQLHPAIPDKSIAVLPLVNESGDPQQDYFSDGLSEELISALGQVHDLKVIGRNSSFQFRGKQQDDNAAIGLKLGVATLLEGTVRKLGGQIRIVASLINATDGSQLWSQTYDRELKDVFAVQSEIATSVAGALKTTLLGKTIESADKPPSGNLEAYNALLQGRFYADRRNREDYFKAVEYYQQAIKLDPNYALPYARLAIAEQWFIDWAIDSLAERESTAALARSNARKAVELNPQLAVAQGALGVVQAWSDLDIPAAEATLKKAVALDPANAETLYQLADVRGCLGRLDESVAMMRKVLLLEPLNASYHFYIGQFLLTLGRLDEAEIELRRAIDLQPTASGYHEVLSMLYVKRGQADQALAAAEAEPPGLNRRVALALAYSTRGEQDKADSQLKEMIRLDADAAPMNIVEYYAYRGDADQAFAWMDHALQVRDPGVTGIYEDALIFPALHNDPRFAAFCKKVGLPVPGSATSAPAATTSTGH